MALIGNLGPYVESEEDFDSYCSRVELFFDANSIEAPKQVSTFLTIVGAKTFSLVKDLVSPRAPGECSYAELVRALKSHYRPQTVVIFERFKFYSRNQENSESLTNFVAAIKARARTCEFGANLDEMLRDRLVMGLRDQATQRALLTTNDLTFTTAVELASAREAAWKDAQEIGSYTGNRSNNQTVNKVYSQSKSSTKFSSHSAKTEQNGKKIDSSNQPQSKPKTASDSSKPSKPCSGCGGSHWKSECPYKTAECRRCKKKGHLARVCYTKPNTNLVVSEQPESDTDESTTPDEYVYYHKSKESDSNPPYMIDLSINGVQVPFEYDTGATRTIMSKPVLLKTFTNPPKLKPSRISLWKYGNIPIPVCGELHVSASVKGINKDLRLVIVDEAGPTLLGRDWIPELNIKVEDTSAKLSDEPTIQSISEVNIDEVLREFPTLFDESEVGNLKGVSVNIDTDPEIKPKFCNARSIPHALREKVDVELDRLLKAGIIEPVKYSQWAAAVVPVLKPNKTVRLCGDYRLTCNKALLLDKYPLPKVEELFGSLAGGKYFSKLDMSQAYMQLSLAESSKDLTTINTHRGLFRYNRLCFGIASAPGIFQRTMESVLGRIPGVAIFLDDILVSGENKAEHLAKVKLVLQKLEDAGLRLSKTKCTWVTKQVEYLGYKIDAMGIHPTNAKLEAIQKAPAPTDVTQLKAYLGLLNFYRKFIPKAATLLEPLNLLLRSNEKWNWGKEQEKAFEDSKTALLDSTLLVHFDPKLPITVSADSSSYGVGAVLSHRIDGVDRPVCFVSRSLTEVERRYAQVEREALALVFAVKRFHFYLWGQKFKLVTDHKPLLGLFNANKSIPIMASGRIQRWALILQAYNFDLVHCSGKLLGSADALSRLPLPNGNECIPIPAEWINTVEFMESTPVTAKEIAMWTKSDPVLTRVLDYCYNGWPDGTVDS